MTGTPELRHAGQVAPFVSPDRIRLARELRDLTQSELAQLAGQQFSPAALSQLERGRSQPSAPTLAALATALGCPVEFFVSRPGDRVPEGFFRSLRSTTARARRQQLARARLLADFVRALEEYVVLPELDTPRLAAAPGDQDGVEAAAEWVRDRWGLGDGPLPHVIRVLERHGVVVARAAVFRHEIDAFSVNFADRPVIVLGVDKAVTARSRFDAAHELAHLVLHAESDAGTREVEQQAHQFAAAFLMPRAGIADSLPDTADWRRLAELKTQWRVSISALLMRARTLGVLSEARYRNAMKTMSARGWRREEPGDDLLGPLEAPVMLGRAVSRLAETGTSVEELCAEAGLPADAVLQLLSVTRDPRPAVEL